MSAGEIILYRTEDGRAAVQLRAAEGTVWLTQADIAALFGTTPQNITQHVKAIYAEGELSEGGTCKELLQVRSEGEREVGRTLKHYSLEMILAIGYRVRSLRGTQFRQWATVHLREYLVKGFLLDDARLKEPGGWDYFDELLARIREIRASEKRFYQKIRDIYATASDYDKASDAAQLFFKRVQNKMLWAVTRHTAPELIAGRADASAPNMGLTTWQGSRVRKQDVTVAKNYLNREELEQLDRIVVMYLDYAEDQARRRRVMTMQDWEEKLDAFLQFNEREVLTHAGKLRADLAEELAIERYGAFDAKRREEHRLAADRDDISELEVVVNNLGDKPGRKD